MNNRDLKIVPCPSVGNMHRALAKAPNLVPKDLRSAYGLAVLTVLLSS